MICVWDGGEVLSRMAAVALLWKVHCVRARLHVGHAAAAAVRELGGFRGGAAPLSVLRVAFAL